MDTDKTGVGPAGRRILVISALVLLSLCALLHDFEPAHRARGASGQTTAAETHELPHAGLLCALLAVAASVLAVRSRPSRVVTRWPSVWHDHPVADWASPTGLPPPRRTFYDFCPILA